MESPRREASLSTQKHSNSKNKCVKKVFEKLHFFNMLAHLLEFDKFSFRVARRSMAQSIARRLVESAIGTRQIRTSSKVACSR